MDKLPVLAALSESERDQAMACFRILQPFLEGKATLSTVTREQDISLADIYARFREIPYVKGVAVVVAHHLASNHGAAFH